MITSVGSSGSLTAEEKSAAIGFAQTFKALDLLAVEEAHDTAGVASDAGATTADLTPIPLPRQRSRANLRPARHREDEPVGRRRRHSRSPCRAVLKGSIRQRRSSSSIGRSRRAPRSISGRAARCTTPTRWPHSPNRSSTRPRRSTSASITSTASPPATRAIRSSRIRRRRTSAHIRPWSRMPMPGDQRVARKTETGSPKTYQGLTSNIIFTVYDSPTAPIPIVRNEELVLLRAQANIGLNNPVAASRDINYVRVHSGGLAAKTTLTTAAAALDQLLYEKRYSLLWESGSRWIDARLVRSPRRRCRRMQRLTRCTRTSRSRRMKCWPVVGRSAASSAIAGHSCGSALLVKSALTVERQ